nr:putative zinc finger A20 and AN1 domain-containing stress-associated protein 8 [Nicotiana tomentosiformis]
MQGCGSHPSSSAIPSPSPRSSSPSISRLRLRDSSAELDVSPFAHASDSSRKMIQWKCAFLKEESAKSAIALSEKLSFLTVDDTVKTKNDDGLTMKTKTQRIHRYPEEHACTFNFKSMGRVLLAKENPLCKADKLEYRI